MDVPNDVRAWLPRVLAELQELAAWQLEGSRLLQPGDVEVKQDASGEPSVVTRFDVESESRLRDFVQRAFPGHSFLGEEQGHDCRDDAHYWIADPIDGTSNFVDGIPYWGTSLAYWRDGVPELGVITFPALGHVYAAARLAGAWLDGRPLLTPPATAYTMLGCVALDSRSHLRQALGLGVRVRILGSAIANQCFTASGVFLASATRAKLWDVAAGALLLRESGAVVESWPPLDQIEPAAYAADGAAPRITLHARASAALPPIADYLVPVPAGRPR